MRIGTQSFYRSATQTVQRLQREMGRVTDALSSGKRLQRPSDDPVAAAIIARTYTDLAATQARQELLQGGIRMCREVDAALGQITDSLFDVAEEAARALQPTAQNSTARATSAAVIRSLAQTILSAANAKSGERYLFAGYQDRQAPFEETPGGALYHGDSNQPTIPLGNGRTCPFSVAGDALLNYVDKDGKRAVPGVDADVFSVLENLATAIEAGDTKTTAYLLDQVRALHSHVLALRGSVGAWQNRLETNLTALGDAEQRYKVVLSEVESTDIAQGVTEYKARETNYLAALQVLSSVMQLPTLFDLTR
jgi:flagellar hook-associated protein 3 FlgL